ncbi:hypothetical protein [Phocaeicola sp.]|uniref:hypothetical protein n=1 Tax=Phocaeicola sp. TaxID=2773926 RepID=UPI0023C52627|nr:hypothetical protein [Phocaeicola sp.]MDE5676248.1 hypothetical protein [Phocaeicola sp.]
MNKNEEKAKATEEVLRKQTFSNESIENEILSNEDAENLAGGNGNIEEEAPSESVFGLIVCCG